MELFDYAFTLCMILFPAVFSLFIRLREATPERLARSRKLSLMLWLATIASVAVYLLLARSLPAVAYFMWFLFFPLWFLLTMPLLRLRDPGWRPVARGSVRSASLVRRDYLPPSLRVGWIAIAAFWGLLLCLSIAGLALAVVKPVQWWLLAFSLAAGAELAILHWGMRRSMIEPEPASPDDSAALRAERDAFRRFKLNGWFAVAALTMLIFSLPPLLLIWYGNAALIWAIAIGAGGGTLVGIGGGIFGTMASIKRARINRLGLDSAARE